MSSQKKFGKLGSPKLTRRFLALHQGLPGGEEEGVVKRRGTHQDGDVAVNTARASEFFLFHFQHHLINFLDRPNQQNNQYNKNSDVIYASHYNLSLIIHNLCNTS